MSDNDSSSEDDDYKPSNKEVKEAEADGRTQKRRKTNEGALATVPLKVRVFNLPLKRSLNGAHSCKGFHEE